MNVYSKRVQVKAVWAKYQRTFIFAAVGVLVFFSLIPTSSASVMNVLGIGSAGTVTSTLSSIQWNADPSATPPGPPCGSATPSSPCQGEVTSGTNLSFAGCSGVINSAGCLSSTEGVEIDNGLPLTNSSVLPVTTFFQFAAHPNLVFELTQIGAGSSNVNCAIVTVNQTCSLYLGSPIIISVDSFGNTSASIGLAGIASDTGVGGLAASTSRWSGSFSVNIPNMTPAQVQNFFCPGGTCTPAEIASSTLALTEPNVSGSFFAQVVVPEPATLLMIGLGLIGIGVIMKRRTVRT